MQRSHFRSRAAALLSAVLFIFAFIRPAAADIGPGGLLTSDGNSIVPGAETKVRMESERVEINIQPAVSAAGRDESFAVVDALFNMRNLGDTPERMRVKFPLNDMNVVAMSGDELRGFQAWVNGEPVEHTFGQERNDFPIVVNISWAYFEAVFPPGELVPVRVSYILLPRPLFHLPNGEWPMLESGAPPPKQIGQVYTYTLVTGKDWNGTIGRAEIVVNFPYPVGPASVLDRHAGSRLSGRQVTWVKKDFEPAEEDNYWVQVVSPADYIKNAGVWINPPVIKPEIWWSMLDIQHAGFGYFTPEEYPVFTRLADCYKQLALAAAPDGSRASFSDYFAGLALTSYQKALKYVPGRRSAYIGMAELLLAKSAPELSPETRAEIITNLNQARAIPLARQDSDDREWYASENQRIEAVYQDLQKYSPPAVALPTLNPLASPLPTQTPWPTYTEPPYYTRTPKLKAAPTGASTRTPTQRILFTPADTIAPADTAAPLDTITPVVSPAAAERKPAGWLIAAGVLSAGLFLAFWVRWLVRKNLR